MTFTCKVSEAEVLLEFSFIRHHDRQGKGKNVPPQDILVRWLTVNRLTVSAIKFLTTDSHMTRECMKRYSTDFIVNSTAESIKIIVIQQLNQK